MTCSATVTMRSHLDHRLTGQLENKRDLSPYRNLKARLEAISLDPRYALFGSLTVHDSMTPSELRRRAEEKGSGHG